MKRTGALVALAALIPVPMAAGSAHAAGADTVSNCGVDVELEPVPQRIFAVNQTMIELTYALGAGDRVVANAFLDNEILPELTDAIAAVPYHAGPPSREQVIAATPDLVVAQFPDNFTDQQLGSRASLHDLGIRTWLAEDLCPVADGSLDVAQEAESFEKNFAAFRRFAQILGPESVAEAEALIAAQEAELEALADRYHGESDWPTVAFVQFEGDVVFVHGGNSMSQAIAEAAGVENVFADRVDGQAQISIEQLIAAAPDHLVVTTCCGDHIGEDEIRAAIDQAITNPALAVVPAVANDRFIPVPFTALYAGVRNVDAASTVAEATHPDA